MRQLLIIIFTLLGISSYSQENNIDIKRIDEYVTYLNNVELSAKNYILMQFQKYDIVIIAERYHQEETQYELINEVINDDFFISNVGNVCIEIGSSNLSDSLNCFLNNYNGTLINGEKKLLEYQRNISFYPLWNRESYRIFLSNLLTLNQNLNEDDKINLYLCDREFEWNKIKTKQDWEKAINNNRDSIMAQNISKCFDKIQNSSRRKMLVILNEAHAIPNTEWTDMWQKRAAQYLSDKYGKDKIASILINSLTTNENDEDILLQGGYWDAAFKISNKTNIGFDFNCTPFGLDKFDYALGKNNDSFYYKDIFTGFVFYKPLEQHKLSTGVNQIIDENFRMEFLRRIKIYNGDNYFNKLKADSVLKGWNQKEYYNYDNIDNKKDKIREIERKYLETKN